jgi:hypothetical protein
MSDVLCPDCGHDNIKVSLTCHTWPQGNQWMHCQGCDSALEYDCRCWLDDDTECNCMWDYTHGLNPGNPRHRNEEMKRPEWLVGDLKFTEHGFAIAHKDVEWI